MNGVALEAHRLAQSRIPRRADRIPAHLTAAQQSCRRPKGLHERLIITGLSCGPPMSSSPLRTEPGSATSEYS